MYPEKHPPKDYVNAQKGSEMNQQTFNIKINTMLLLRANIAYTSN